MVIGIFVDLKRAFETIDRLILIKNYNGIDGRALSWFDDYLKDRFQKQK